MKKYSSLIVGIVISVLLLVGIGLFNFKFLKYFPDYKKDASIKLLVTWINNIFGLAFFTNVGYFGLAFLKTFKEEVDE